MAPTHSQKLTRWIPKEEIESISLQMKDWYGPPIALGNVPGKVYAHKGGDFSGHIEAGSEASLLEFAYDRAKRLEARASNALRRWLDEQYKGLQLNTGFTGLADLISEAAAGKTRRFSFSKVTTGGGIIGQTRSLWRLDGIPAAGAQAGVSPNGTFFDNTSTGGMNFDNPESGDLQFLVSGSAMAAVAGQLLLYDRLWAGRKTMSSNATEAYNILIGRYLLGSPFPNSDPNDLPPYGNFIFPEVGTALSATAHNWTTCLYTDQGGNSATLPSVTGIQLAIAGTLDIAGTNFFCPLADGDTGVIGVEQLQCSSNAVTGAVDFVVGHPIAWFPCPIVNVVFPFDAIQGAFQFERILDNACLALLHPIRPATTANTFIGNFKTVAG